MFIRKNKWFKKPNFIPVSQGNLVVVQGLKGKKGKENREIVEILNLMNLTTKRDLIPVPETPLKSSKCNTNTSKESGFSHFNSA